jgi:hypothetical protein
MITRLEATRYRCFERLGVDVGDFRVLVGANGSGKTTLLDLPVLLGDLLRTNNVSAPFMESRPELPPRAGSLNELVFAGRGSDFSLAVEARLPKPQVADVLRYKGDKSLRQHLAESGWWPADAAKPPRPKEAAEWVLKQSRQPRSSAIYQKLAEHISIKGCTDVAFAEMHAAFIAWFPQEVAA